MRFTVVTTGLDDVGGVIRAHQAQEIAIRGGGSIVSTTNFSELPKPSNMSPAEILLALALWGKHHAGGRITEQTLGYRLNISRGRFDNHIVHWVSAGYLRQSAGRPPTYELTTEGTHRINAWVKFLFNGSRIAIDVPTNAKANLIANALSTQVKGIVFAPSDQYKAPPPQLWSLALMISWLVKAHGGVISAPRVAGRLIRPAETLLPSFHKLDEAKLLVVLKKRNVPTGKNGVPADEYELTPAGRRLAVQYVSALLA